MFCRVRLRLVFACDSVVVVGLLFWVKGLLVILCFRFGYNVRCFGGGHLSSGLGFGFLGVFGVVCFLGFTLGLIFRACRCAGFGFEC